MHSKNKTVMCSTICLDERMDECLVRRWQQMLTLVINKKDENLKLGNLVYNISHGYVYNKCLLCGLQTLCFQVYSSNELM